MEISAQSLSHQAKLPKLQIPSSFTNTRASLFMSKSSVPNLSHKKTTSVLTQFQGVKIIKARQLKRLGLGGVVFANSEAQIPPADVSTDRWLLEPVGDGDSRHIGFKVAMPNAFEIASDEVTVGRLPDKADLVIPVATVSAQHARIQKKDGRLLVTDLDSTNGTFIDDKRLRSGEVATVPPGSCITFGDIHLAIFRVSKLEETVEAPSDSDGSKAETDSPTENT
ncbi:hypothetical protein TIFTF001_016185 [Ficus carica]|uniref:FHA domain-containing protein n=1 Tax=Ficus carica TaxID=3494 RepID=A0AA87ZZW4_FICCA|nr:hypothetical protein TIFTF001_016185 [Ficus carica]